MTSPHIATILGFVGLATPGFLLCIILLYLFHKWFGISIGGFFSAEFRGVSWSWARLMDMLQHLWVPVLVISGGKSLWFGPKDGERVAANYPVSQHVVLPNAAMMPWFDDPAGFDKAVRTFMKRYVKN